ncbi:cupin domain-containing protein [Nocardioides carbamazepini]|uniref:cupin domain-containing protein n=1 Tax=Nocardioides carbamazepini TaxID=2854259 RepID=UPI00214A4915|nr:cupin domain-containing protein [Nocardioides carbamazepini]MCR1781085.1 cupin domain-containing protein [Nocardioides carbamazepini]
MTENLTTSEGVRVISRDAWGPDLGHVDGGAWREIVGARTGGTCRSLYAVELGASATTVLLQHPGEAVYYVCAGRGEVVEHRASRVDRRALTEGSMVHVRPGATYRFESAAGMTLLGGPSPVDPDLGADPGPARSEEGVRTYHRDEPGLLVPFISRDARLVVWLGEGAVTANMNYVVLEPGERNTEHVHAVSEDTIHILEGHGTAENVTTGERLAFGPGDTIHIEIGFWHAVAADRGERVVSIGGPCPADVNMLRAAGVDVDAITRDLADVPGLD